MKTNFGKDGLDITPAEAIREVMNFDDAEIEQIRQDLPHIEFFALGAEMARTFSKNIIATRYDEEAYEKATPDQQQRVDIALDFGERIPPTGCIKCNIPRQKLTKTLCYRCLHLSRIRRGEPHKHLSHHDGT